MPARDAERLHPLAFGLGGKQVGKPLGLGKVDPAIVERAPGELPRDRGPHPRHRAKRRLDGRDHRATAM